MERKTAKFRRESTVVAISSDCAGEGGGCQMVATLGLQKEKKKERTLVKGKGWPEVISKRGKVSWLIRESILQGTRLRVCEKGINSQPVERAVSGGAS